MEQATTTNNGMPEIIYQDLTPEERLETLRNTADQVVMHDYQKPYDEEYISEIRKKIADLCVQISDQERELASIKAQYKAIITPLENDREDLISDLRSGGQYVTEECFVFMNYNTGKAGLYTRDGVLLVCKDITADMSQGTIFQMLRGEEPDDQGDGTLLLPEAPQE